jgi:hypothetical protein
MKQIAITLQDCRELFEKDIRLLKNTNERPIHLNLLQETMIPKIKKAYASIVKAHNESVE